MKISIYGTGYVGLITGVCFADLGHTVICYDIDKQKIEKLKRGEQVLHEKNFDELFAKVLEKGSVHFTRSIQEAALFSNVHLMCVGTPSGSDGSADLSYLFSAVENLASYVTEPFLIVIRSTVPVGTSRLVAEKVEELLLGRKIAISFDVVSCPEFMAQGEAVKNFMEPERIIIGAGSDHAFEQVKELYAPLLKLHKELIPLLIRMSPASAELTKYASNAFLATKISLMNEISRIAEFTGADISEVVNGTVSDSRIGPAMSRPGCGFGGSCLPKDLKALIHQAKAKNFMPYLLNSVLEVNFNQKNYFISQIFSFFNDDLKGKVIAIWGLAFKPNTDDLRGSISCDLIELLLAAGAVVQAYDPAAGENIKARFNAFPHFHICQSKEEALDKSDLLAVMTEWPEFHCLDTELVKKTMKSAVLFDGRNMYDSKDLPKLGISYFAIGKGFKPAKK